uniref:Uncharacterized protein n=1 Tax=Tetranychus urticae TaxID=32264 RepID=T1KYS7_TETUR
MCMRGIIRAKEILSNGSQVKAQ